MSEIKVNYASIDEAVSKLNQLKARAAVYGRQNVCLEQSSGEGARAVQMYAETLCQVARAMEQLADETACYLEAAKESFIETDTRIGDAYGKA